MTTTQNPSPTVTVLDELRTWWDNEIALVDELSLPEIAETGAAHFTQQPDFCERFCAEMVYRVMIDIGRGRLSEQRRRTMRALDATRVLGRDDGDDETDAPCVPGWDRWFERDPATGYEIRLFTMTREQALAAADVREARGTVEYRIAGFLRALASRCAPGQRIGDVWSCQDVTAMEQALVVERPVIRWGEKTIWGLIQDDDTKGTTNG